MDPYKVLGVAPDATDEQIKAAYRDLARKYHPDNYANNPLADLAQEKMKQINEAYDTIQKQRKASQTRQAGGAYQQNQSGTSYQSYQYGSYSQGSASQFADIRRLIMQHRMVEAEELLDGVPAARRSGEWYFLKGNILYNKGWLDEAYRYFSKACQLEPSNREFQTALQQLSWQRGNGRPAGYGYGAYPSRGGSDICDIFSTLICADCCCECMGGDLIRCC
ncbi:MAG: DnaJ domain-containing protein [Negativibacillus sp.]